IFDFWLMPQLMEIVRDQAPGVVIRSVPVPQPQSALALLESGDIDIIIDNRPVAGALINCDQLAALKLVTMMWDKEQIEGRTLPLELYLTRPHIAFQTPNKGTNVVEQALAKLGHVRQVQDIARNFFTTPAIAARNGNVDRKHVG